MWYRDYGLWRRTSVVAFQYQIKHLILVDFYIFGKNIMKFRGYANAYQTYHDVG